MAAASHESASLASMAEQDYEDGELQYEDPNENESELMFPGEHDGKDETGAGPDPDPAPGAAEAAQQPWGDVLDNTDPPPPDQVLGTVSTLFSVAPTGAGAGSGTKPHMYEYIYKAATGTASLPSVLTPEGKVDRAALAFWSKGDFREYFPSPHPDGGVRDTGVTLTELCRVPDVQVLLTQYGLGEDTITRLQHEAQLGSPITETLNDRNKFHPTTNPRGFPSRFDRTIGCDMFLNLRDGTTDVGCELGCKTHVTKNGPNKGMVRLACASTECPGYRTMTHDDINKGAGGMLQASRVLINYLALGLAQHRALTYQERATKVAHILIRFTTLTWGQLRYEAIRRAASEQESMELSGSVTPASTPSSARGRGRGRGRGPSRSSGRATTPVATPRAASSRGGRIGPIRQSSATIRRPATTQSVTLTPDEAAQWRAAQHANRAQRR